MIADRLEQAGRYRGMHPGLDRGLEALRRLAGDPPPDGRHELEGRDLYAILSTYEPGDPADKRFEAHRRYADIQVVLRGGEVLYWAPLEGLAEQRAYAPEEDIAFYEDPPGGGVGLPLEPGAFAVLFPEDAHKPGCRVTPGRGSGGGPVGRGGAGRPAGGGGQVRKLVVKVRL
jgi:YhcH/YjgK/YiaL family protein